MLSLLGWIPVIGPLIDGIVSIFGKFQDTKVAQYKVDGEVAVQTIQSSTAITLGFMNDIPIRIARDLVMFPGSVWCGLFVWDKIVEHRYPDLVWVVHPLNGPMEYLPFALMTFFFGMSAMNTWNRK